jgi:hypothetical protein
MNEIEKKLRNSVYIIFIIFFLFNIGFILIVIDNLKFYDLIILSISKLTENIQIAEILIFIKFIFILLSPLILLIFIFIIFKKRI